MRLEHGKTYRNRRGDLRGPMVDCGRMFLDQYGTNFYPDGTEVGHVPASTANIVFPALKLGFKESGNG